MRQVAPTGEAVKPSMYDGPGMPGAQSLAADLDRLVDRLARTSGRGW